MALPTLTRTWQFQNNVYLPQFGDLTMEIRKVIWSLKNTLTTFPTSPWKCVASSNAVTCLRYGVDSLGPPGPAYDTWGVTFDYTKIHGCDLGSGPNYLNGWSTYDATTSNKHSWIILRNTALDTTYDLCIQLKNNFNYSNYRSALRRGKVYICRSYNLTGSGSITARPSPNSGYIESELRNGNADNYGTIVPCNQDTQVYAWRIHAQMSTDGLGTRLFLLGDSRVLGFWAFDRILGADPSYPNPVWACIRGKYDSYGDAASYGWLHDNSSHQKDAWGTTDLNFYLSTEGIGSSTIGEAWGPYPNEVTNKYPMTPIGVASGNAGKRGRVGYLADLWFGQGLMDGTMFPSGGSRLFANFNSLIIPWDGTNPAYVD